MGKNSRKLMLKKGLLSQVSDGTQLSHLWSIASCVLSDSVYYNGGDNNSAAENGPL
jgi:hypothetical protein